MAISSLKEAAQEISRLQKDNAALQDRNQALEVENAELRDQLALAGKGKKLNLEKPLTKADLSDKSGQSDQP